MKKSILAYIYLYWYLWKKKIQKKISHTMIALKGLSGKTYFANRLYCKSSFLREKFAMITL